MSVVSIYDVSMNPEFIESKKSRELILTEFLSNFMEAKGNKDKFITKDKFVDYYTDLSNALRTTVTQLPSQLCKCSCKW